MTVAELKKAIAKCKDTDNVGVWIGGAVYDAVYVSPKYVTKQGIIDDRKRKNNGKELVITVLLPLRADAE